MEAYIYDCIRTPRGKGKKDGAFHSCTAVWLSSYILDELNERNHLDPNTIEDVIWGNVTQVGEQGGCIARAAILMSNLSESIAALTLNRFCGSGLEAVNLASNQVKARAGMGYIAGGVEMLSRVPMGTDGSALMADPSVAMEHCIIPQGVSADLVAAEYNLNRDDCDQYAVTSQQKAANAWSENRFSKSVIPVRNNIGETILDRDEHIRPETNMQSLASLEPSFKQMGETMPGFDKLAIMKYPHHEKINHVHHAGNSSGIVDGAAAVLIGSEEFGKANNLTPRARIISTAKIGSEPTIMLTGPIPATEKALNNASMSVADIDLFEVNEAFAAVPLMYQKYFDVEDEKINVNGGSIAMGHPLGATGAILLGTLVDELERSDKSTGLVTLCVAGGMGVATIVERV